jgi:hypothetical protein
MTSPDVASEPWTFYSPNHELNKLPFVIHELGVSIYLLDQQRMD